MGVAYAVRPLPVLGLPNQNLILSWPNPLPVFAVLGNYRHSHHQVFHAPLRHFDQRLSERSDPFDIWDETN